MRKATFLLLSLVISLGVLAPAALAGRCSDTGGGCGGSGFGGGGYTQRDSGLWVPTYTQRSAPVAVPDARSFGKDLAKDLAKDAVKVTGVGALAKAGKAVRSAWRGLTPAERRVFPMMPIK